MVSRTGLRNAQILFPPLVTKCKNTTFFSIIKK